MSFNQIITNLFIYIQFSIILLVDLIFSTSIYQLLRLLVEIFL